MSACRATTWPTVATATFDSDDEERMGEDEERRGGEGSEEGEDSKS